MSTKLLGWMTRGASGLRELGPYALVELVLPGGSLVVALLWMYRRYRQLEGRS
jgi:hypothetical protein